MALKVGKDSPNAKGKTDLIALSLRIEKLVVVTGFEKGVGRRDDPGLFQLTLFPLDRDHMPPRR